MMHCCAAAVLFQQRILLWRARRTVSAAGSSRNRWLKLARPPRHDIRIIDRALPFHSLSPQTALYVVMVCVGAPFGSNGKFDPVWNKGAIVGASGGGYLWLTVTRRASRLDGFSSDAASKAHRVLHPHDRHFYRRLLHRFHLCELHHGQVRVQGPRQAQVSGACGPIVVQRNRRRVPTLIVVAAGCRRTLSISPRHVR